MTALASRPVLGFRFWDTTFDGADPPRRAVGAVVPFWAVAGLFAVLPSLWGAPCAVVGARHGSAAASAPPAGTTSAAPAAAARNAAAPALGRFPY